MVVTMASLRTKKTSVYWWACFTNIHGQKIQRSTGVKNTGKSKERNEALRIACEYEEVAKKHKSAKQVRKVIEEMHQQLTGQELPSTTLRAYVQQWLAQKEHETKDRTLVFYEGTTRKFLEFLGDTADQDIIQISKGDIDRFRAQQIGERKLAPKTVNHDIKCIKMLFKAARKDGFISEDVSEHVNLVKEGKNRAARSVFTMDQIRTIIDHADPEWRSMTLFGVYTGQRLGDIASLTWSQIFFRKKGNPSHYSQDGKASRHSHGRDAGKASLQPLIQ